MPVSALAASTSRVSGRPVKGSLPPGFAGVLGGGLSKVIPSTVGETDGVAVPPAAWLVVLPPAGGVVVLPPAGGVVVAPPAGGVVVPPLAGHALMLAVVVPNWVVAGSGTTTRPAYVASGLRVGVSMTTLLDDGLPSALALATKTAEAPQASTELQAAAATVRRTVCTLKCPRITLVTTQNPRRGCEEAVKRAGASRSRRRQNLLRPGGRTCRREWAALRRASLRRIRDRSSEQLSSRRPSQPAA